MTISLERAAVQRARPARRTQEQRSAATRARLLEATIEVLISCGYAATTTTRVAEAAGVTRGAQVHHFPTKEDLVLAAVAHLNKLHGHAIIERLKDTGTGDEWIESVLDGLWQLHSGTVFMATAEIFIAARTDAVLASHLGELEAITTADLHEALALAGESFLADHAVRDAIYTAMDAMRGLVMTTWHLPEAERAARWMRLRRHLTVICTAVIG